MTAALLHRSDHGKAGSSVRYSGVITIPDITELERAVKDGFLHDGIDGWNVTPHVTAGRLLLLPKPNLVVNSGINRSLDRLFGISGPPSAVTKMMVDNGTVNPSATTDRSADGNSTTRTILAFDSTATRASQVVSANRTHTQANVTFIMKRLGMSSSDQADITNAATADTAGTLYAMTNVFTVDLTGFTTWSLTWTGQITGTGS